MITSLKDYDGKIIAHLEWRVVGKSGYDQENGEYIWISDLWIHESFRNSNIIRQIIDKVMGLIPDSAKYGYFQRLVHNEKKRIYSRNHFERMRLKGELIS